MPVRFKLQTIQKDEDSVEKWINSTITCAGTRIPSENNFGSNIFNDGGSSDSNTLKSVWPWVALVAGACSWSSSAHA